MRNSAEHETWGECVDEMVICNEQGWEGAYDNYLSERYESVQEFGQPDAMTGAELIAAERQRQVEAEGWTPEHDAEHDECEMLLAALCYANRAGLDLGMVGMEAGQVGGSVTGPPGQPHNWPWARSWWKPSDDPIRNLVKAGALIAAEIDRLQRRPTP